MTAEPSLYRESLLSTQKLREAIREARGGFAPDQIARALLHRRPQVMDNEAGEIATLLRELIGTARDRLHDAGIEPQYTTEESESQKLTKRERGYAANLAALLAFLCVAETHGGRTLEAAEAAREGLAWCRVADDQRQMAILWRAFAGVHVGQSETTAEQEQALRNGLDAARRSKDPEEIVLSLDMLCSFLVVQRELAEAERLNEEALEIVRTDLKEQRGQFYPALLLESARIKTYGSHYGAGIQILREALRWADADAAPMDRAAILAFLGSVYLRLGQFRQSIECQHEVVQLADRAGSNVVRGWGYFRLAEAHMRLGELELTEKMLDNAEQYAPEGLVQPLSHAIVVKRAQLLAAAHRYEEAVALCEGLLDKLRNNQDSPLLAFACTTLAEVNEKQERFDDAERYYRLAIEAYDHHASPRVSGIRISLAKLLLQLGRPDESMKLIDEVGPLRETLPPDDQARLLYLCAALAERRGSLRDALDYEREAVSIERSLIERQAEESLKNARIVAENDLLEREAETERERRRRVERELADAIVQLGDRKRLVESLEQRLRKALAGAGAEQQRSIVTTLRETLAELRAQSHPPESPIRYLNVADDDFYRRLRQRCPDLTPKQERLCGLLRSGLASKEISTLLGLGAEGLKAQRKRLRKKLGLQTAERLETALATL